MGEITKRQGYNGNENLKSENVSMEWTQELIEEYIKCANDIIYWAEKYIKIISVDDGVIPIRLYEFQKEIIEAVFYNRQVIVLTGRQQGKCVLGKSLISIRKKSTDDMYELPIEVFYEWCFFKRNIDNIIPYVV